MIRLLEPEGSVLLFLLVSGACLGRRVHGTKLVFAGLLIFKFAAPTCLSWSSSNHRCAGLSNNRSFVSFLSVSLNLQLLTPTSYVDIAIASSTQFVSLSCSDLFAARSSLVMLFLTRVLLCNLSNLTVSVDFWTHLILG